MIYAKYIEGHLRGRGLVEMVILFLDSTENVKAYLGQQHGVGWICFLFHVVSFVQIENHLVIFEQVVIGDIYRLGKRK